MRRVFSHVRNLLGRCEQSPGIIKVALTSEVRLALLFSAKTAWRLPLLPLGLCCCPAVLYLITLGKRSFSLPFSTVRILVVYDDLML